MSDGGMAFLDAPCRAGECSTSVSGNPTARTGWSAAAILAVACSNHATTGTFPDGGGDASVDSRLEASPATDEGTDGDAAAGPDAAELPECDNGKTCALPLTCDETDLLCEPPCDGAQPCGAGTFCTLSTPGSLGGNCIGPDYECLGDVPPPPAPSSTYFEVTNTYLDVSSGVATPAVGLTVKVCLATDAPCATPQDTSTTDASGHANLTVPAGASGFDGYFDVTGPSADGGTILETIVFSSVPVLASGYGPTTNVETAEAFQQSVAALGTLDATRAQLIVVDDACRSTPAFGASLAVSSADSATKTGYVGASGIEAGASTFPVNAEALAYVVNVPGASTTLTTTFGGRVVNELDVVLRPNVLSTVFLDATPPP
jgi:hypothetical protein